MALLVAPVMSPILSSKVALLLMIQLQMPLLYQMTQPQGYAMQAFSMAQPWQIIMSNSPECRELFSEC